MKILKRESLPKGGFAGIKETRLIVDHKVGGDNQTWDGIGNFVYLADAQYVPHGESKMHPHREIDVIAIVLEGGLDHEGSLKHGKSIQANQVQVQRAGAEGFEHNEVNPAPAENRMLQLWVLPENLGEPAGYKFYELKKNQLTRIYGGRKTQSETFDSHTIIEVGLLNKNKELRYSGEFLAYITAGQAILNDVKVKDGDLIRGKDFDMLVTSEELHIVLMTLEEF